MRHYKKQAHHPMCLAFLTLTKLKLLELYKRHATRKCRFLDDQSDFLNHRVYGSEHLWPIPDKSGQDAGLK